MANHNLLGEYNGKISVLMYRYGESTIKNEDIFKYIKYTLHKHLNMDNVNAIMEDIGSIHGRFKLVHDENDLNGLYKIYKVTFSTFGYISAERLIARFWIDSKRKTVSPRAFVDGLDEVPEVLEPEVLINV